MPSGLRSEGPAADVGATAAPLSRWLVVTVLVALGTGLPLLVSHHFGALGIPRGDDASYLLSAFRFADHGELNGSDWTAMNLVGQIVAAWPIVAVFGHHVGGLQAAVALLGTVGLYAVYDIGRPLVTDRRALFVAITTAVGPLWLGLAPTFLTDVPAFAFAMISLAFGLRALRRAPHRTGLLAASFVVGFAGFTIREYAVVAPLAIVVGVVATGDRAARRRAVAGILVLLGAAALFFVWRRHLPGFTEQELTVPTGSSIRRTVTRAAQSVVQLGCFVAPVVVLVAPTAIVVRAWRRAPRTTAVTAVAAAVALAGVLASAALRGSSAGFMQADRFLSNQWTVSPGSRALLPPVLATLLEVVGIASFVVLVLAAIPPTADRLAQWRRGDRTPPASPAVVTIAAAVAGFVVVYGLDSLAGGTYFPRYLLPLVPLVSTLVLAATTRAPRTVIWRVAATASLAVLGVIGVAAAGVNASLEGDAWSVARSAAATTGDPGLVDGGFDWNAWHAGTVLGVGHAPPDACIRVSLDTDPPRGAAVVVSRRAWSWGDDVWVVARRSGRCPGG